jgi:hypothetical protein
MGLLRWLVIFAKVMGAAEMFLVLCERWPRRALRVFKGRRVSLHLVGGFSFGAFPLLSSGRGFLYSHGQTAIRKRARKWRRLHYDVFGSGRGTSTLNLQSEFF